jgi:DNA-binding transcriptional ArsR family regulator
MLHLEKEISLLNLNKVGLDSLALDLEEGEYFSAVKEGLLRKKARRNLTLSKRTLTLHLDVRILELTKEDKDLELSFYKELKKPKIIRDILGFIIFKEHTKEEH